MIKRYLLIISFFSSSLLSAGNDSLKYKVKFSASINGTLTKVSYAHSYTYSSGSNYQNSSDYSSSFQGDFNSKIVCLPEFDLDIRLPWNFKLTLGGFVNQIKFTTPELSSLVTTRSWGGNGGGGIHTTFSSGDFYYDKVNLFFLGDFFGFGYCYQKNKIMFDIDAGIKQFWLMSGGIERKFNSVSHPDSAYQFILNSKMGYFTNPYGLYGRMNISYRINSDLYWRLGASFMYNYKLISETSYLDNLTPTSGSYNYSIDFTQFSINTGIVFVLR